MNKSRKPITVSECKIQASILLKSLHSSSPDIATQAVKRFLRYPEFAKLSQDQLSQIDIKLKHALAVIALENNFKSWVALKTQIPFVIGGYLNSWFANYAEAKTYQEKEGGFLLSYKKQFFICESSYIEHLGFDSHDPDWQKIGFDWENPQDKAAWQRLYKKWMKIQEDLS